MPNDARPNVTILIIDDEKVILDLTSIILRNRGYNVLTAMNARDGLRIIGEAHPQLVLLDYMMPVMDGLTALKEIKRQYGDTYVVMFTGKGGEEIAVELMKAGASDYILKPFNNQDLAERIENVLKMREIELRNRELLAERERLLCEIEVWNRDLERRVQEKSDALQKAQSEIVQSEKLATLGYLSAGMAHEIRNPLNSIALFGQLIKGGTDDPEQLEYVDKILKEVDRIDGILRKLLNASNRPRYEISEVAIGEVIDKVLDVFSPQIHRHDIKVVKTFHHMPPAIPADPSEIEQIFTNLFLNAIHEMHDGGSLGVELDLDGQYMVIRVSDTGRGITEGHLQNIFDPFFTTKGTAGSGLGLSVVLRIVKTYDGKIEVEKSDADGTTFCLKLPVPVG